LNKRFVTSETMIVWIIVVLNVLLWVTNVANGLHPFNPSSEDLLKWGGNYLPKTAEQPWRLLSSAFLHVGVTHLAWNMVGLVSLGLSVLRFYGVRGFVVIYFFAAIVGGITSLFFGARAGVSVGASGAILGLLGAIIVAALRAKKQPRKEDVKALLIVGCVFVSFSLFTSFSQPSIDNAAHFGGLIAGALAALGLPAKSTLAGFPLNSNFRLLSTVAACVLIVYCLWIFILFWFGIPDA
jgi:rhomboid protease GluP